LPTTAGDSLRGQSVLRPLASKYHNCWPRLPPMSGRRLSASSTSSFVQIHEFLFLALYEEAQATKLAHHALKTKYLVVPCLHIVERHVLESFVPCPLQEIYKFDELANQASRKSSDLRLVFCGGLNTDLQTRVVFLLGCHMVVSLGMDPKAIIALFQRVEHIRGQDSKEILEAWWSLHCAKIMGWIKFEDPFGSEDEGDETIRMDEYLHYCRSLRNHIPRHMPMQ
jgi:hypothetical protein